MKLSKILTMVVLVVTILSAAANVAFAVIDPASITGASVSGTSDITNLGNKLVTLIQTVGSVVSVIILIVLGIKYMMGSTEEKAEYKKTLIPYVVGAILIFAASNIASIAYKAASNMK